MSGTNADDALLQLLKDDQQSKQKKNDQYQPYQQKVSEEFLHQPQDNVNDGKNVQLTFFQNTEASLAKKLDPVLIQLEQTNKQLEEQKKLNQKLQNNLKTLKKSFEQVIMDQQEQIQNQQKQIDELQDLVTQTLQMTLEQQKQQGELKDECKTSITELQDALLKLQVNQINDIQSESKVSEKSGLSNSKIIEDLVKRTVEQEINTKIQDIPLANKQKESDEYLFQETKVGSIEDLHQKVNEIIDERLKTFTDQENKKIEEIISTQINDRLGANELQMSKNNQHQCVLQHSTSNIQQKTLPGNNTIMRQMHFSLADQSKTTQQNNGYDDEIIDFAAEQLSYKAQNRGNKNIRTHDREHLDRSINSKKFKPDYAQLAQYQLKNLEKSFKLTQQ